MPAIELGAGQPAVFVGPMGCGKTNLIAWNLEDVRSAVVIDSKRHPDEWAAWGARHGYVVTDDPRAISQHPLVVWQVHMHTLLDVAGYRKPGAPGYAWTDGLARIMKRGSTVAVFDELAHQLPAGRPHPSAVQILTQSRAYKISAWGGSQYANRVETMILRGAVHCFAFRLNPVDLKYLTEHRGVDVSALAALPDCAIPTCSSAGMPHSHGFGYHATNTPAWQLCEPVERVL